MLKKKNLSFNMPLSFINGCYIEIFSGKEAVLTGDAEIIDFEDSVLKIKCGAQTMIFSGKLLEISSYNSGGIRINGKIDKIEFCDIEEGNN